METSPVSQAVAVVFCDMAGTSQLTAREGDLAVAGIIRAFMESAGRLAEEYRCRFIKFIGDGFIATFDNTEDALPMAQAVQETTDTAPGLRDRHLRFRFSLHFGNVLSIDTSYGTDIFGTDINTAARLNDLAQPGELVISQAAFDRLPAEQRALARPAETSHVRRVGEMQIHRVGLATPYGEANGAERQRFDARGRHRGHRRHRPR